MNLVKTESFYPETLPPQPVRSIQNSSSVPRGACKNIPSKRQTRKKESWSGVEKVIAASDEKSSAFAPERRSSIRPTRKRLGRACQVCPTERLAEASRYCIEWINTCGWITTPSALAPWQRYWPQSLPAPCSSWWWRSQGNLAPI
jgi:hypothetical protein